MPSRLMGGIIAVVAVCSLASSAAAIGPVVRISITPSSHALAAGTTAEFSVEGVDALGAKTDLTKNSTFTTTDPRGFMTAAVYTGGTAGTWMVTANYNDLTADANVTVTPGVTHEIVVNPNSQPEYLLNGESRTFTAEAFDAFNNQVKNPSVQWSLEGNIGTITSTGSTTAKLSATSVGKGRIVAKSQDEQAFVEVTVTKASLATNSNVNGNANANTNAPPSVNTNTSPNAGTNTSAPSNENTNQPETIAPVNENTNSQATASTNCTAWPRIAWIWLYIGYVVLLALSLFALRRSRPNWWWMPPLVLTVAGLWLYFQFRCGTPAYPGLPYLILLTAIVGTSWYTWQRGAPEKL